MLATDSARKREIAVRGATTQAVAWQVVGASVALGAAVVPATWTRPRPRSSERWIGYAFSEGKQVLAYYFGSSVGSDRKTELKASAQKD